MLKKTGKSVQIRLTEEKFYFPGERIEGNVIVQPNSPMKINCIQLRFFGRVCLYLKEKQVTPLFEQALTLYADESHKPTVVVSEGHAFPFLLTVPSDSRLPSSMQFGKKCFVRYTISAVIQRPMLPESLCPRCEYDVSLLEYIDVGLPQLKVGQEKTAQVSVGKQNCILKASMPRMGFTRGDVIPLSVVLTHFTPCSRQRSIQVELVRHLEIRTAKHTVSKETVLKSTEYDLTIHHSLQQTLHCPLLIPTSTPPTLRYLDKLLRFHYRVRATCQFTEKAHVSVPLPIVIGTWPRAAIPIDDEESDQDEMSLDIQSIMTQELVNRSNSVKSYTSASSWQSWDNRPLVPTHVLQPVPATPVYQPEDSSDSSDEEDDLLVILKKKRRERQQQAS